MVEVLKPGNDYLVLIHDNLVHDSLEIGLDFFFSLCASSLKLVTLIWVLLTPQPFFVFI